MIDGCVVTWVTNQVGDNQLGDRLWSTERHQSTRRTNLYLEKCTQFRLLLLARYVPNVAKEEYTTSV